MVPDRGVDEVAAYYNDASMLAFYSSCWGGSDIHIGLYASGSETVAEASVNMTRHLIRACRIQTGQRVLDISCGFGGTLRLLAELGCEATGMDISRSCVERARRANVDAGYGDKVKVEVGDFHAIHNPDHSWDAVICQESLIHSKDRPRVFQEVFRVLKPFGVFGFSDILTKEGADLDLVRKAFARLKASAGATRHDYEDMARSAGFELLRVEERSRDIQIHYNKLAEAVAAAPSLLDRQVRDSLAHNIEAWRLAILEGSITWACFVARKPG